MLEQVKIFKMSLSADAIPFFSCTDQKILHERDVFLYKAQSNLSHFDFRLLCDIFSEWECSPLMSNCLKIWKSYSTNDTSSVTNSFHILSFNVRGFNLRYQEVVLLSNSFKFDILILLETDSFDLQHCHQAFSKYKIFFQTGENPNGGVIILVRNDLKTNRVRCDLPNICIVDILEDEPLRIAGIYATDSKSWNWEDLTPFVTSKCALFGDFNVDLEKDKTKADFLMMWADSQFLTPFIPCQPTSMRSERIIDYVFTSGFSISIQTYKGGTASDHKPILSIVPVKSKEISFARNIHWNVFSTFCDYVFPFWEKRWHLSDLNNIYNDYISFISFLTSRCTVLFLLDKYRIALPQELRAYMSHTRALSFRQKRTGNIELKSIVIARRKCAKKELKRFLSDQLASSLATRNTSSRASVSFWSRIKKFMKSTSSSLHGFILNNGEIIKNPEEMCETAADYYEDFFKEPENIYRPHPYTDAPEVEWENYNEEIPPASVDEILDIVCSRKKKKSCDAHGLSNFMFNSLPPSYWSLLVNIFNLSFSQAIFPVQWKDTRILLLAKKESICNPSFTRPISLLDVFLKINEKLFLTRFSDVVKRRGILPDTQSGFRAEFRLQTRVLLFFEQVASLMANSSPVATIFVDSKAAFDQLWFEGCLGKLKRMGLPRAYLRWINTWLQGRRAYIEIAGKKSRWFNILKGGPQGSIFSATLFITYHADMGDFLGVCLSHFFADDLAAVVAGSIGMKYTAQCLDLEKKLQLFFENLEYYSTLTAQPINYAKTEGVWSARAIGPPKFDISTGDNKIQWTSEFKYLGYWVTPKLGFGTLINKSILKIRQRVGILNSIRITGCSSPSLRKALFLAYVLPLFTWLFPLFPLFTKKQQQDLNHFYYTCLKRVLFCLHWSDNFFAFASIEISLEDRCLKYWDKYFVALADTTDGELIFEEANLNALREGWLRKEYSIKGVFK
jgi:hypothetical protein